MQGAKGIKSKVGRFIESNLILYLGIKSKEYLVEIHSVKEIFPYWRLQIAPKLKLSRQLPVEAERELTLIEEK